MATLFNIICSGRLTLSREARKKVLRPKFMVFKPLSPKLAVPSFRFGCGVAYKAAHRLTKKGAEEVMTMKPMIRPSRQIIFQLFTWGYMES